jgi:hypothetical protein
VRGVKLFTSPHFPLSIELVLNQSPTDGDTKDSPKCQSSFLILSNQGRYSNVFVGRIIDSAGSVLKYLAIKVQKNWYPFHGMQVTGLPDIENNMKIEDRWKREFENYRKMKDVKDFVPQILEANCNSSCESSHILRLPPLLFCRKVLKLFSPRCIQCYNVLETCKDENALSAANLPSYGLTVYRFLYCKNCYQSSGQTKFYTFLPSKIYQSSAFREKAGNLRELLLDLEKIVLQKEKVKENQADIYETLEAEFPCFTCNDSLFCFGRLKTTLNNEDLTGTVEPFCFYDSYAILSELLYFQYDEFSDLLGGMLWEDFEEHFKINKENFGDLLRLNEVKRVVGSGYGKFLFENETSGIDAVEVLRLKLTMFLQLLRCVFEFLRRCNQPLLNLEPKNILIDITSLGECLPTMWNFKTKIVSLCSAQSVDIGDGFPFKLYRPPSISNPVFAAQVIRKAIFGRLGVCDFVFMDVDVEKKKDKDALRIKGQLQGSGISSAALSTKDCLRVLFEGTPFLSGLVLNCLLDEEMSHSKDSLFVKARIEEAEEYVIFQIKELIGIKIPGVKFTVYPCFHVPCDIYSLGMLFFRTILVNDEIGLPQIEDALDQIRNNLSKFSKMDSENQNAFLGLILELINSESFAEIFNKQNIFYNSFDRVQERLNAIPDQLWYDILIFGLRFITNIEGFSLCKNHGDFDYSFPAGRLEPVIEDLERLIKKLDSILFNTYSSNQEARQVIEQVLLDLEG